MLEWPQAGKRLKLNQGSCKNMLNLKLTVVGIGEYYSRSCEYTVHQTCEM